VMSNPAAKSMMGGFRLGGADVRVLDMNGRIVEDSQLPTARVLATGQPVIDQTLQIESAGGSPRIVSYSALPIPSGAGRGRSAISVQLDITERSRADARVRESEHRMRTLLSSVSDGIIGIDAEENAVFCNPAAEELLGKPSKQIIGQSIATLVGGAATASLREAYDTAHEETLAQTDGGPRVVELVLTQTIEGERGVVAAVLTIRDITQRRALQQQLSQAQKLEAIGQLAAGVAHEINTPTQYIGDNLRFLCQSVRAIIGVVDAVVAAVPGAAGDSTTTATLARVHECLAALDWEYLRQECPRAVDDSLDGVERVTRIVSSMKEFAHPDTKEKQAVELNRVITSATNVCRNEWKYVAELVLDLEPALPQIVGYVGDIGQVVVNLVVNAAHAIGERGGGLGRIVCRTRVVEGSVEVSVTDNGAGIPDELKPRLFEQFFTTKAVGKGTGQGLSLVHRIVVGRHGGRVRFESTVGVGTTFFVTFPLN
jgi:two-component system, NtrC family, sensor kinase